MAEHTRQLRDRHLAVEQVQVGAADAASEHADQKLAFAGDRHRSLDQPQWLADALEDHRIHVTMIT
jgi:hypothetical protein